MKSTMQKNSAGLALTLALAWMIGHALVLDAQIPYSEQYRPQFHFSPSSGWIGDPDGTIRYQGQYHLFWWGHAVSSDLVFWNQLAYPMAGDDGSFVYYDGSVVVDRTNKIGRAHV